LESLFFYFQKNNNAKPTHAFGFVAGFSMAGILGRLVWGKVKFQACMNTVSDKPCPPNEDTH
jgi:hypothetical protein